MEFATTTPFLNDYHLFTTGTAMLLAQHPGGPITVITLITLVSVLLMGLGAVAASTALGAGRTAALIAVVPAVATGLGAIRLAAYRPEGFGMGLALLIVALGLDWLRRRDRRSLVTAALLVATLSQVHGIAAVAAGVMVTAAALALLARAPRREQVRRTAIALGAFVVAVVATALVFREASGTAHAGGLVDTGGLGDPTWEFYRAARGEVPSLPPSNLSMMHDAMRDLYNGSWWWIVPALLVAGYGVWRRRDTEDGRLVILFTLLSLVGLGLVASVFMLGWQGYVPAPDRRLAGDPRGQPPGAAVPRVRARVAGRGDLAVEGPRPGADASPGPGADRGADGGRARLDDRRRRLRLAPGPEPGRRRPVALAAGAGGRRGARQRLHGGVRPRRHRRRGAARRTGARTPSARC